MDKAKRTLSIEVEGDTTKLQQQLRAIAKHVGALADELDAIDNNWQCDYCGSYRHSALYTEDGAIYMACAQCGKRIESDELPTHPEGSD